MFIFLLFYVWDTYRDFRDTQEYIRLSELTGTIANLDDVLTMAAKTAAGTGDLKWEKRYRSYEKELNDTISEAISLESKYSLGKSLLKVDDSNKELCEMTDKAFNLVRIGQLEAASYLLNNEDYENQKKLYRAGTDQITSAINSFIKERCEEYHFQSYVTLVFASIAIPFLLLSWISVSRMLRKHDTDHDRFQLKLMESEQRFRDLTENTSDWIWEINCQLQFTYTNPNVKDILGYTPEELIGKRIYDFMSEDEVPKMNEFAAALAKNPQPFHNLENKNIHKDGSLRILETSGIPIYCRDGTINGYRGIDRDITDRRQAEKALWQEQNLLNRITETSPIGITVLNRQGVIIYANNEAVSILGLPKEKLTHLSYDSPEWKITDFEGKEIPEDMLPFNVVRKNRKPILNFRHALLKNKDEKIFLSMNSAPLLDNDGNFDGMVSAIEEITEQVKAENEKELLIKKLQKALLDVRTLSGLLPICAKCKKVRDDKGYWSSVEKYIQKRSSVKFSHGFCPECFDKYCSKYFSNGKSPAEDDTDDDEF
ncbi:MAG: hypothetical protein A2X45_05735 [Lentisphaerae bacterium GWF2_50_93]|nr:MAG: hypothetical protein A2X45_05735 [Lentisphaerae bacterium GWF2_50_93]